MMIIANIYEAKTNLSKLIKKALEGEEVILAKLGKPVVKLVPTIKKGNKIKFGLLKGKIKISSDFDEFGPELKEMFKDYMPVD